MQVTVPERINAAAVFLLVKLFPLADLNHARGSALFTPVIVPVHHTRIARRRTLAAVIYLLHVLPAGDPQRAADDAESIFCRIERRTLETHIEAHGAADAALGFPFHAFRALKPVIGVVIGINKRHAVLFRKANILLLTNEVFLLRMDIGVIEENGVLNARRLDSLHHFTGAGGAAGVQQQFVSAVWQGELRADKWGCRHGVLHYVYEIYGRVA